jgi:hypothetical protein
MDVKEMLVFLMILRNTFPQKIHYIQIAELVGVKGPFWSLEPSAGYAIGRILK